MKMNILDFKQVRTRIGAARQLKLVERLQSRTGHDTELPREQVRHWQHWKHSRQGVSLPSIVQIFLAIIIILLLVLLVHRFLHVSLRTTLTSLIVGAYLLLLLKAIYLRYHQGRRERLIDYYTPLSLEALALLMRSGLSLVPAMREVSRSLSHTNPLCELFGNINSQAAAGIEFSQALKRVSEEVREPVLVHTLTCLRNNAERGGEMLPALEQLVEHTHKQWLARVGARVRKLEAQVVLPVFCAVIGLMLLIVAVPAVPVIEMLDRLEAPTQNLQRNVSLAERPTLLSDGR